MSASERTPNDECLVVIGASAGGIDALGVLLSSLDPGFPAPIVIAQHLDPHRTSELGTVLERRSHLPVRVVRERTKLEPGVAFVAPENGHVIGDDGHVLLSEDVPLRPILARLRCDDTRPWPGLRRASRCACRA